MSPRLTRNRLLISLLIWGLLLCHGAFGSLHLASDPAFQPVPTIGHPTIHHPSGAHVGEPEGSLGSHHADTEYFAVLLGAVVGGLALWFLLRNGRGGEIFTTWHSAGSPPAIASNLPRGPTLPLLQVLRL